MVGSQIHPWREQQRALTWLNIVHLFILYFTFILEVVRVLLGSIQRGRFLRGREGQHSFHLVAVLGEETVVNWMYRLVSTKLGSIYQDCGASINLLLLISTTYRSPITKVLIRCQLRNSVVCIFTPHFSISSVVFVSSDKSVIFVLEEEYEGERYDFSNEEKKEDQQRVSNQVLFLQMFEYCDIGRLYEVENEAIRVRYGKYPKNYEQLFLLFLKAASETTEDWTDQVKSRGHQDYKGHGIQACHQIGDSTSCSQVIITYCCR